MYIVEMTEKNVDDVASCYVLGWKSSHEKLYDSDYVQAFSPEKTAAFLRKDQGLERITFVAYDKGKAVGFITIDKEKCDIPRLYVIPEKQRQGVGTKLIEFGIKQLSAITRIYVSLLAANEAGVGFFEDYGFEFTGEQRTLKNGQLELKYVYKRKK
ncbi:MAG: GNAT family N-acetyltransferase [Candidatus Borkfalkiaceae bacterium]|nr:GNAT family N-acetyltransferase [Christensenellaceae bacterium]